MTFWLYETESINTIQYVIKVGPIKTPGQVQDSTGLGNDDFNKGLKESKYGYPILEIHQLDKPLPGSLMKDLIGILPPYQFKYATIQLLLQYPETEMKQIFCLQKVITKHIQVYATCHNQENNLN